MRVDEGGLLEVDGERGLKNFWRRSLVSNVDMVT
jgi:hypothetical protein